jgi:hypothetical protein
MPCYRNKVIMVKFLTSQNSLAVDLILIFLKLLYFKLVFLGFLALKKRNISKELHACIPHPYPQLQVYILLWNMSKPIFQGTNFVFRIDRFPMLRLYLKFFLYRVWFRQVSLYYCWALVHRNKYWYLIYICIYLYMYEASEWSLF